MEAAAVCDCVEGLLDVFVVAECLFKPCVYIAHKI